jgi:hypothetical protein
MALIPRLVSGSSAKRPEPSGINAMPRVQKTQPDSRGLDPAIYSGFNLSGRRVDARIKSGHDDVKG